MKLTILENLKRLYAGLVSELLKYIIAGGIAFIIDFSTLMFLYKIFDVHYLKAAAIGLFVGLITTYILSVKWVFRNRVIANTTAEFGIFITIGLIGFMLNESIIWFSVEKMLLPVSVSKLIATGIIFIWNFTARKIILFRSKTHVNE